MLNSLNKLSAKGGPMPKTNNEPSPTDSKDKSAKSLPGFLKVLSPQTAVWIGATIVFAALFFMSSVLDMKVHVTFGQGSTGTVNSQTTSPGTATPAGGIASQVGGC